MYKYPLKRSKNSDTPVATSTHGAPTLVSNTILQNEEPGLFGETADCWTETENIQDRPGACYSARKEGYVPTPKLIDGDTGAKWKSTSGQSWNNLSKKN